MKFGNSVSIFDSISLLSVSLKNRSCIDLPGLRKEGRKDHGIFFSFPEFTVFLHLLACDLFLVLVPSEVRLGETGLDLTGQGHGVALGVGAGEAVEGDLGENWKKKRKI